jgi:hypothetical protein
MRTPASWLIVLIGVCVVAPYAARVRPRSRVDWIAMTVTIGFLLWLLGGFASVRSR